MTSRTFEAAAAAIVSGAVDSRIFPAAVAEVGDSRRVRWTQAFGTLTFDEGTSTSTSTSTIFDLASLTKAIATTSVVLDLDDQRALSLDETVARSFPEWTGADRADVRIRDLLEHASGLPARLLDRPPTTRREFVHDICTTPLEYAPRHRSIYSDLDFILLGFLAADRGGAPLDVLFRRLLDRLRDADNIEELDDLGFGVPATSRATTAPTEPLPGDLRAPGRLQGVVHDDYAAALGGVAGHAGLFATAAAVGAFARLALRGARGDTSVPAPLSPAVVSRACQKSAVPGSSRALGWDTMLSTSSCGTKMSPSAFGHPGFTGTSLWIDPDRDRYFVLLTNRVCGGGTTDAMQRVRRSFHDALGDY